MERTLCTAWFQPPQWTVTTALLSLMPPSPPHGWPRLAAFATPAAPGGLPHPYCPDPASAQPSAAVVPLSHICRLSAGQNMECFCVLMPCVGAVRNQRQQQPSGTLPQATHGWTQEVRHWAVPSQPVCTGQGPVAQRAAQDPSGAVAGLHRPLGSPPQATHGWTQEARHWAVTPPPGLTGQAPVVQGRPVTQGLSGTAAGGPCPLEPGLMPSEATGHRNLGAHVLQGHLPPSAGQQRFADCRPAYPGNPNGRMRRGWISEEVDTRRRPTMDGRLRRGWVAEDLDSDSD